MANKLDRFKSRKLQDLVVAHRENIEKGSYTFRTFGEFASRSLDFTVTEGNVRGAAEVVEVHFKNSTNGANGLANFRELRAAIKLLAEDNVKLRGELGVEASPTIRALAGIPEVKE